MPVLHVQIPDAGIVGGEAGSQFSFACYVGDRTVFAGLLEEAVRRAGVGRAMPDTLDIGSVQLTVERGAGESQRTLPLAIGLGDQIGSAQLQSGDVVRLTAATEERSPWRQRRDPTPPPTPPSHSIPVPTPAPAPTRSLRSPEPHPTSLVTAVPGESPQQRAPSGVLRAKRGASYATARSGATRSPSPRARNPSIAFEGEGEGGAVEVTVKVREKKDENFSAPNFVIAAARRLRIDPAQVDLISVYVDNQDQHGFSTGPAPRGESNRKFIFPNPKWDRPRYSSTPGWTTRASPFSHELRRWVVVLQLGRRQAIGLRRACANAADPIHAASPGIVECRVAGGDAVAPGSPTGSTQLSPRSASKARLTFDEPSALSLAPSVSRVLDPDMPLSGFYHFTRAEIKLRRWTDNPQTKCVAAEARCQWKTYFLFPALNADTSAPWAMSSELQQARRLREYHPPQKDEVEHLTWTWEPWSGVQSPRRDGGPLYRPPTPPLVRHEPLWLDSGKPREDEKQMQLSIHASWQCSKKKPREGCGRWNALKNGKCWCDRPRPKDVTAYAKARFQEEEHGGPGGGRKPWQNLLLGVTDTEQRFGPVADGTVSTEVMGVAELTPKFPTPQEWNLSETVLRLNGRKLGTTIVETREKLEEKEHRRRMRIYEEMQRSAASAIDAQEEWDRLRSRLKTVQSERDRVLAAEAGKRRKIQLWEESCGVALGRILRLMDMETAWRLGLWLHWEE
eukprot:Hpha_TRINITY_DN15551_c3_g5::TRINITY_DN15551_c3_g5_i1::g.106605::m.106605